MNIGELKALIKDLPDDMQVLITSDEEWNEVRKCDGFNMEDYVWCESEMEIYSSEDLDDYDEDDDDDEDDFELCLILC